MTQPSTIVFKQPIEPLTFYLYSDGTKKLVSSELNPDYKYLATKVYKNVSYSKFPKKEIDASTVKQILQLCFGVKSLWIDASLPSWDIEDIESDTDNWLEKICEEILQNEKRFGPVPVFDFKDLLSTEDTNGTLVFTINPKLGNAETFKISLELPSLFGRNTKKKILYNCISGGHEGIKITSDIIFKIFTQIGFEFIDHTKCHLSEFVILPNEGWLEKLINGVVENNGLKFYVRQPPLIYISDIGDPRNDILYNGPYRRPF